MLTADPGKLFCLPSARQLDTPTGWKDSARSESRKQLCATSVTTQARSRPSQLWRWLCRPQANRPASSAGASREGSARDACVLPGKGQPGVAKQLRISGEEASGYSSAVACPVLTITSNHKTFPFALHAVAAHAEQRMMSTRHGFVSTWSAWDSLARKTSRLSSWLRCLSASERALVVEDHSGAISPISTGTRWIIRVPSRVRSARSTREAAPVPAGYRHIRGFP